MKIRPTIRLLVRLCGLLCLLSAGPSGLFAGQRPNRVGLWVMQKLPEDPAALEEMSTQLRANPIPQGICLNFAWKNIEKEAGKPDFTALDKAVAIFRGLGLKYELCLKPGADTPAFVYEQGAQSFATQVNNPHRANAGQPITIPVPWDPVYQRAFSAMIEQLGARYASDPLCVSVVLTCANFLSAEMHLPKTRADLGKWSRLGNYEEKLFEVYSRFTDQWAKSFPRQQISLHLSKVLDLPPRFNERVIEYGLGKYPDRFNLQSCQLNGRKENTGMLAYDLIQKYRDRAHHGFQSLAGLSRPNERMGSLEMAALNIVHAKGEYWELWHGDGMNPATTQAVARTWHEAQRLGYEAYKKKLVADGKYRP